MLLSVVIVNWNSREHLRECLTSLARQSYEELEVIVVDNGSADGSTDMVRSSFPSFALIAEEENLGFAEGCNRGIARARGEWIALLNNDAIADPRWAEMLAAAARRVSPDCGMLQSLMLFLRQPVQVNSTGIVLTRRGSGRDRDEFAPPPPPGGPWQTIFCPTGGAAAYRRSMLDELRLSSGILDPDHFCYYEDLDLGWRARLAGYQAHFIPESIVHHRYHGSTSRRSKAWMVSVSRTNRLRTLAKNASYRFMLFTLPTSLCGLAELVWHGGLRAVPATARALGDAFGHRTRVEHLRRLSRRSLEQDWIGR